VISSIRFPPIDYSDRPQYIAQSASGALYYSTRPTSTATPGTLRRIDNFLDDRTEPRQIWQYASFQVGKYVIINSDAVSVQKGANSAPDIITICDHPGENPSTAVCYSGNGFLISSPCCRQRPQRKCHCRQDLDVTSLALPDTNFVAAGGDRRRIAFGGANSGGRAGRVLLLYDPTGTPAGAESTRHPSKSRTLPATRRTRSWHRHQRQQYEHRRARRRDVLRRLVAPTRERVQTFNTGAGIAFHPLNVEELT
jgi:hypothetical protein